VSGARRLFVPQLPAAGGRVALPMESVRHAQVLRVRLGQDVCLFDSSGGQAEAKVVSIDRDTVLCDALPATALAEREARLTLVLGVPKAQKLDDIARMATELGVHAVRLAQTEHCVPKLAADSHKLERVRRIAREACAQSGQPRPTQVLAPEPLTAAAGAAPEGALRLVFWEQSVAVLDQVAPAERFGGRSDVWAVVGPEGGLSAEEVAALSALGYQQVGLGDAILRVDTAVLVISALLLDRMRMLCS
jgi:16S rRNA (uracil1498-N3)-methyltransferase